MSGSDTTYKDTSIGCSFHNNHQDTVSRCDLNFFHTHSGLVTIEQCRQTNAQVRFYLPWVS